MVLPRLLTTSDAGYIDVRWHGAVGDGVTDDTEAFSDAVAACVAAGYSMVRVPPGAYRITSSITCAQAITFYGDTVGVPGGIADETSSGYPVLLHDFDGDFFVWTGSVGGSTLTSGGGMSNLRLAQAYQTGAAARGRAVYAYATDAAHKPSWLFFQNLVIEESDASNPWTWNLYFDGSAANTGLWDVRIENINAHCDGGSGGLYVKSCANFQAVNCDFFLDGNITVTGTAGFPSANTRLSNVNGNTVALDYINGFTMAGGTHGDVSVTANAIGTNVLMPARVATGGEAAFTDSSGLVGRLIYRPLLDGSAGASAWYASNSFALPNSRWFLGVDTLGDTVPMLGVDVNNRVRLVPYADAAVVIGTPLNLSGVGASDLAFENTKGLWSADAAGTNAHPVIRANADDQVEVGDAAHPLKFHGGSVLRAGTGSPEGVVTGNVGDIFHRTDGGSGTALYVKESGTGNTGWVAVATGVGVGADGAEGPPGPPGPPGPAGADGAGGGPDWFY